MRSGLYGVVRQNRSNCREDLTSGTLSLQKANEKFCGFAITDGEKVRVDTHQGLVVPGVKKIPQDFKGSAGIGYVGPFREPLMKFSRIGEFAIATDGYLLHADGLQKKLFFDGQSFSTDQHAERILALIASKFTVGEGMKYVLGEIEGAHNILLLGKEGIYAARDLHGFRPLTIGRRGNAWAVSSDSCAFNNGTGFVPVREIKPGEVVFLGGKKPETISVPESKHVSMFCARVVTYDAAPDSVIGKTPIARVRHRLGANLLLDDLAKFGFSSLDTVIGAVPNSGNAYAEGGVLASLAAANSESGFTPGLPGVNLFRPIKYVPDRTHLSVSDKKKDKANRLSPIRENFENKRVIIWDDRLVSGVTIKGIVEKLFKHGAREVHVRIACPPSFRDCPFDYPPEEEEAFLALTMNNEEMCQYIGATSLRFQDFDQVPRAIEMPMKDLCLDCFRPK